MRIIALPLARLSKHNTMLVSYHFDLISPSHVRQDVSWHGNALKSMMNKATDLWTHLGKAPRGSWKLWTHEVGERIADRVEFEEFALRGVDPSSGPFVSPSATSKQLNESQLQLRLLPKIPLIYPPSLYPACLTVGTDRAWHPALAHLRTLLAYRGPRHRRGFYSWMLIAPLTVPITLIPLIPNFPFFFCVWRSWSHYKAYRSSQYLSSLLDHQLIEPNPSIELDKLYASFTSSSRASQELPTPILPSESLENISTIGNVVTNKKSDAAPGTGGFLPGIFLTRKAIPLILAMFHLPESAAANLYRAVDQARGRLRESS